MGLLFSPPAEFKNSLFSWFWKSFYKTAGGYGYAVILDDGLRIVASLSSRVNILEKPVL